MAIVSYRTEAVKLPGGGNVYEVRDFSCADQGVNQALEDGLTVPTIPLLVGMEGIGKNVISSSLRISMERVGKPDVSVYMHVPLYGSPGVKFLNDDAVFKLPDISEEKFGKLINMDRATDDNGNELVYVVDNKDEMKCLAKVEDSLQRRETGKPFFSAVSMEDLRGLRSVNAFFGGQENFKDYAERHSLSEIDLNYIIHSVKAPRIGSAGNKKIEKLALIAGSPGSFRNFTMGMELYCMDTDNHQSTWHDFLKVGDLPG